MNQRLQFLFDELETERLALLKQVMQLSTGQLSRSASGKWSAAQILGHLIAAEKLSVRYLNKKIPGIQDSANTGILEDAKMVLLKISQRLPFKFKAPKTVVDQTPSYTGLPEIIDDWEKVRNDLKVLLEKFDDDQTKRKIYRHVRAGMLNIEQALIFFLEHHRHHLPQIRKAVGHRQLFNTL